MKANVILTDTVVVLSFKNSEIKETLTFDADHSEFNTAKEIALEVIDLLQNEQKIKRSIYERTKKIHTVADKVANWTNGDIVITPSRVTLKGKEIGSDLASFLIELLERNNDAFKMQAWANFLKVIDSADSFKISNRLFAFLEKTDLRIDENGNVLAWKVVRPDYKDKHSRTFDNSPGQILEMPRNEVNDDDNSYCSYGFHICSWGYLSHFASSGDKVVQVRVAPADIISIPLDYNGEKVRCCKYEVVCDAGTWGTEVNAHKLPKLLNTGFDTK